MKQFVTLPVREMLSMVKSMDQLPAAPAREANVGAAEALGEANHVGSDVKPVAPIRGYIDVPESDMETLWQSHSAAGVSYCKRSIKCSSTCSVKGRSDTQHCSHR